MEKLIGFLRKSRCEDKRIFPWICLVLLSPTPNKALILGFVLAMTCDLSIAGNQHRLSFHWCCDSDRPLWRSMSDTQLLETYTVVYCVTAHSNIFHLPSCLTCTPHPLTVLILKLRLCRTSAFMGSSRLLKITDGVDVRGLSATFSSAAIDKGQSSTHALMTSGLALPPASGIDERGGVKHEGGYLSPSKLPSDRPPSLKLKHQINGSYPQSFRFKCSSEFCAVVMITAALRAAIPILTSLQFLYNSQILCIYKDPLKRKKSTKFILPTAQLSFLLFFFDGYLDLYFGLRLSLLFLLFILQNYMKLHEAGLRSSSVIKPYHSCVLLMSTGPL
ncbi:hypothetical protein STEG23_025006, partial [Scotinomys teguina]